MKSIKIALIAAAAFGTMAAKLPAPHQFATWDACIAVAIDDDPTDHWIPVCVPNGEGGWKLSWSNTKRGGPRR